MKKIKLSARTLEIGVFSILLCLLFLKYILIVQVTNNPDELLRSYKFVYTDSFDWFANGLRLFDNPSISMRNPGLPLTIRLLNEWGVIYLLPLLNQLAFLGLIVSIYCSLKVLTKNVLISMGTALLLFANFNWALFSNYLMADIYAITAFSWAIYFVLSKRYSASFVSLGVSMLFQNFGYFLYPFWVACYLFSKRNAVRKQLKIGPLKHYKTTISLFLPPLLPVLIILPWHAYKWIYFGSPLYTKIDQMALLRFQTGLLSYYSHVALRTLGLLLVLAVVLGVYVAVKQRHAFKNTGALFIASGLLVSAGFWFLFYDWPDTRFLLYVTPWFYLLAGYLIYVVLRNLHPLLLVCLFGVLFYHASLPTAPKVTSRQLPLVDDYYLSYKDFGSLSQAKIGRNKDFRLPWMNVSPILYDAHKKSAYYRSDTGGKYATAISYIDTNYDFSRRCFRVLEGETYTINATLQIRYNSDINKHAKACEQNTTGDYEND